MATTGQMDSLREEVRIKEKNINELVSYYGSNQPNAVELRILGALNDTQREKQHASSELENYSPSPSNASIISKSTVGNNDVSSFNRRMDDVVLNTIVQVIEPLTNRPRKS